MMMLSITSLGEFDRKLKEIPHDSHLNKYQYENTIYGLKGSEAL
jgi:hypothetical protein